MKNLILPWFVKNWSIATPFLAVYVATMLVALLGQSDVALFLIWVQTPIYFLHQFEEYVFPGGFTKFFNTKILGSQTGNLPLTDRVSFWINIPIIWIGFPVSAVLAGQFDISIGIWTAYFSVMNGLSHVGFFFKHGYNPGLLASLVLNIPVGSFTIYYFFSERLISPMEHVIGILIALGIQATLMIYGFKILKAKLT